jgi:hypothetical protein
VGQDRYAPLRGDRGCGREALVVQQEARGPRVELDSARTAVEAARGLIDPVLAEVEPDERDQAVGRPRSVLKGPVIPRRARYDGPQPDAL